VRLPAAGGKGESVHHGELSRPVRTLSSVSADLRVARSPG